MSFGALETKGFSLMSCQGVVKVIKNEKTIMMAERRNNLYYLVVEVVSGNKMQPKSWTSGPDTLGLGILVKMG